MEIFGKWVWEEFDWYKVPENEEDWSTCPNCNNKPRIWVFDNGNFAKCLCSKTNSHYDLIGVEFESIGSYARRMNGDVSEYESDGLRKAWNEHVEGLQ